MVKKTRVWVYLPDNLEKVIKGETTGKGDQGSSISKWIVEACDQYLKFRAHDTRKELDQARSQHDQEIKARDERITALEGDIKRLTAERDEVKELHATVTTERDSLNEQVQTNQAARDELQAMKIAYATLEGESRGQAAMIEELRARSIHAEGLIQSLMAERQALIPESTERRPSWWSRLFRGKG